MVTMKLNQLGNNAVGNCLLPALCTSLYENCCSVRSIHPSKTING